MAAHEVLKVEQSPRETGAIALTDGVGEVMLATYAMGTRFEVVLAGGVAADVRAAGEAALEEVRLLHDRLSAFSPGSVVSRLNERAAEGPVAVAGDVFALLALCREVWAASDGAFDATVGPLMDTWGFRVREGEAWTPPTDVELAEVRGRVGMGLVELNAEVRSVRFATAGVRLDLGAVAKGWALDAAAAILRERGVTSAFIHGGTSSVVAIGTPPGREGWAVHVRGVERRVVLRDSALGVSAGHGRQVVVNGELLGHVIDPRMGRPTRGAKVAAVVGASAAMADAWSTAALVVGGVPPGLPAGYEALVA